MGIIDNLKDLYFSVEEKYYAFLDKVDPTIPIYKITGPIDKVVPSFLVFLLLIVAAVLLIAIPLIQPQATAEFVLIVKDPGGEALEGISVNYKSASTKGVLETNQDGMVLLPVPVGEEVEILISALTIEGIDYEGVQASFRIEAGSQEEIVKLKRVLPELIERALVFQYLSGQRVDDKAVKVRLSCSSGVVPLPREVTDEDRDGTIIVQEPPGCEILQATVLEPVEFAGEVYLVNQSTTILRLQQAVELEVGSMRVKVKDEDGKLLDTVNFKISLTDADGSAEQQKYTQYFGEVVFRDIEPKAYGLSVVDAAGDYAIANESSIVVSANETESVTVIVSKSVKGTLVISAVNEDSGQEIEEAELRLVNSLGIIVAKAKTGEDGEAVSFPLFEEDKYIVYAVHEDYLYGELDLNGQIDGEVEVEMERLTASNSGKIEVVVVDENDVPVENAKVKLRFMENDFLAPYNPAFTDFNGVARFKGVKEGSYYAYVEKFPASGNGKEMGGKIDIRTVNKFKVMLFIGETMLNIVAFDEEQQNVAEAEAEFFSITGRSLGRIPLTDGTGSYSLKADKRVYVVVSHPGFHSVQTMPRQLYPGKIEEYAIRLDPRLISGEPKVNFEGVFTKSGIPAMSLEAGQRYIVKFKLSVPETDNYGAGGVHFRVGDNALLANDPLVIKDVIVGNPNTVLKGSTFTPPVGYSEDLSHLVEGDAKWVNFSWDELEAGHYFFGIEVMVKGQTTPNTLLPMWYRAWVEEGNGILRDPFDEVLGTAESISQKKALYAKAYKLEFYEGQISHCEEEFCYSGEWIYNEEEGLYVLEPYELTVNAPHVFNFVIINNSETVYSNSNLYITSLGEKLQITDYEIQDADAQIITASNIRTTGVEDIGLGNFTKGKTVNAKLNFKPVEIGSDYFEIKIIADGRVVFQKDVPMTATAENNMIIGVTPPLLPAFVEVPLEITVEGILENGQRFELNDAIVTVTKTAYNESRQTWVGETNLLGKALFTLPASSTGSKVVIRAEKPGFAGQPVEMFIDANVLTFDPEEIMSNLSTRDLTEQTFFTEVNSLTSVDLKLTGTGINGYFKGLLDEATMENHLAQFRGTTVSANGIVENNLFKVKLSQNAGELMRRAERLDGSFWLTFENKELGAVYDFVIPLRTNITISGLPETEDCLVISKSEWNTVTQGNAAVLEFEVMNNCMSKGKFLPLDRIVAKIDWQSDIMGNVELSLQDSLTGESNIETLKPVVWGRMIEDVREEAVYYGLLTFTPFQGYLGQDAEFDVFIDGQVFTGEGEGYQHVGSTPEQISSSIRIVNLENCLTYEGAEALVEVPAVENGSVTFTIDSSECGETPIEIEFCRNDIGCSGGAEGGITVSPQTFTLSPTNPSREVTVMRRSIPGMYGIWVSARTPGRSFYKTRLIDVFVEPMIEEFFTLDKYEFSIKGIGNKDAAKLSNTELSDMIMVDASACAWGMAEEDDEGMFSLAGAGIGAALGALMGLQQVLKESKEAGKTAEKFDDKPIEDAETQGQKSATDMSSAADQASKTADQAKEANEAVDTAKTNAVAAKKASLDAQTSVNAAAAACNDPSGAATAAANIATLSQEGADAATTAAETASDFGKDVGNASKAATDASSNATKASETLNKGYNDAKIDSVSNKPSNLNAASGTIKDSINGSGLFGGGGFKDASAKLGTAMDGMTEQTKVAGDTIKDTTTSTEKFAGMEAATDEMLVAVNAMNCPGCLPPQLAICNAAKAKAVTSVGAAKTANAEAESSTQAADEAMKTAQENLNNVIGQNLKPALDDMTNNTLPKANNAMNSAKSASKASEGAAMAASGSSGKGPLIVGLYAMLGAIAGGLAGGLFNQGDDPCEERVRQPVIDFIINLVDDALPIGMDKPEIGAEWNTEDAQVFGDWDRQEVAVVFENLDLNESEPVYSTANFKATKHNHSDPTIIPGTDGGFGPFNIPDMSTTEYVQKIHLKFNTRTVIDKIPPFHPDSGCIQGTMMGTSGLDALPAVKLNWSWDDVKGITIDSCLKENPEAIYCDATQFSIMLNKRLKALNEFLEANPVIDCPANPAATVNQQIQNPMETHDVGAGQIGLSAIEKSVAGHTAAMAAMVQNNSGIAQSTEVEIIIVPPEGVSLSEDQERCVQTVFVSAGGSESASCGFTGLPESTGYYSARATMISEYNVSIPGSDSNNFAPAFDEAEHQDMTSSLSVGFIIPGNDQPENCWMPYSTRLYDGKPALEYYLEEMESIQWTSEVQSISDFRKLVNFKARLMEDGYSQDFQEDFAEFYNTEAFMDAPTWFTNSGESAFIDYFGDVDRMHFTRRYVQSTRLSDAGVYDVMLNIDFADKEFDLFNTNGNPVAEIETSFYLVEEPYPNSIFYYLPFNGGVGKDTADGRAGYGMQYSNSGNSFTINAEAGVQINTDEIPGSTAVSTLTTNNIFGFKSINSLASNRGMLLSIERGAAYNENHLTFYPHYATPIILKVPHETTSESFSAYFQLIENNQPQEVGNSLSFWTGAGQCLDFTGIPVFEKFSNTPDREATDTDPLASWQYTYALDWENAELGGDVYIKSYVYTPASGSYSIVALEPEGAGFITPDNQFSPVAELKGITGMPNNNQLLNDNISELQELFDLVENGDICVTDTGVRTAFWWNPRSLYEAQGQYTSVREFELGLTAGESCIGYGS